MYRRVNAFEPQFKAHLFANHVLRHPLSGRPIARHLWGKSKPKGGDGGAAAIPGVRAKDVTLASRLFEEIPDRHKEHFLQVVDNFENHKHVRRQGYVEFISAALPYLKEYGVHRDLEVYKALMNVFPKGRFRPDNMFSAGFFNHPMEQRTAVEILCAMETNGMCVHTDRHFVR